MPRTGLVHTMPVDRMRQGGVVGHVHRDIIAFAHVDQRARHLAVECKHVGIEARGNVDGNLVDRHCKFALVRVRDCGRGDQGDDGHDPSERRRPSRAGIGCHWPRIALKMYYVCIL